MKILLLAINSRYVHPNLALGYLSEIAKKRGYQVDLKEYTINMQPREILLDSDFEDYDLVAFSAYIWNGDFVKKLATEMKLIRPEALYICGGPEVLGNISEYVAIFHGVIMGEGESPFISLLDNPDDRTKWQSISYKGHIAAVNKEERLDFSYPHGQTLGKKIVYYEAQRGCPYSCSYCMSGDTGVRYRPLDLVKQDLLTLIDNEIPLVKFVDRSFNVHVEKAIEIVEFIKVLDRGKTSFHMELSPSILPQDFVDSLASARRDLFQVEIGIQSTDDSVNRKVYRNIFYDEYKEKLENFIKVFPGHVHLDLISGLPGSTFENIRTSHMELEKLGSDFIQLGFLKLMPGTKLYEERNKRRILASSFAPYEVLETGDLSFSELKLLKTIERMMDLYPREEIPMTMDYLTRERGSFDIYWRLVEKFPKDKLNQSLSLERRLEILGKISNEIVKETLELDYARKRRNRRFIFFSGRKSPGGDYIDSHYDGQELRLKMTRYRIDYENQVLVREDGSV